MTEPNDSPLRRLRSWRPDDRDKVIDLVSAIYAEYDVVIDLDDLDSHFLDPPTAFGEGGGFWVVEDDELGVVACIGLKQRANEVELKSLYVHPTRRRRGWGSLLTGFVEDEARRRNLDKVVLWSDTRFVGAHAMYERLGYERHGQREFDDVNDTCEFGYVKLVGE